MDVGAIETIELATLSYGAKPIRDGVSDTWKGSILTENDQTIAFVKIFPNSQQLISEVVCALIGRALGLNIPRPFLVSVERDVLPESKHWKPGQENCLGFGSEEENHRGFGRFIRSNHAEVRELLSGWDDWKRTVWFDEWIANKDRHFNNILYDGGRKKFWLIDHSHALTGPDWNLDDLKADVKMPNLLIDPYIAGLTQEDKDKWKSVAQNEAQKYNGIQFDLLAERARMHRYTDDAHINAVTNFLRIRVHEVINLACERIGTPRLVQ